MSMERMERIESRRGRGKGGRGRGRGIFVVAVVDGDRIDSRSVLDVGMKDGAEGMIFLKVKL